MDYQLVWTERAAEDLEAIVRYISRRDPAAASRIATGLYDRVQLLLRHPHAGSPLIEVSATGWRKLIFLRWKIVYTLREDRVIIGRIWPAALGEVGFTAEL